MTAKERSKLFAISKGYLPPKQDKHIFRKTENNTCYHYGSKTANAWDGWSRDQRDNGKQPTFKDFYNQLSEDYQKTVTVIPVNIN